MTLYERIVAYCEEQHYPLPHQKERTKIGALVSKYVPKKSTTIAEEDGHKIQVNDYAEESYPAIDFIIQKYLTDNNLIPSELHPV